MASIFDFFKPKATVAGIEQRSITLAGPIVADWNSAAGYGRDVDKLSVVYGCINLRASTIASLPIQLNRKTANGGYEEAKDHPYYNLITKSPNGFMTTYSLWHWCVTQLDLYGNCFLQKIRNNAGEVMELYPLNPFSIEVYVHPTGMPYYRLNMTSADGTSFYKQFEYDEVIHLKGYSREGLFGLSTIDTFRTLFDGYSELETAGTAIAKNAAKPSNVVYYPQNMGEDALEKMKASWKLGFVGSNSGKSAFLPNTIKIESSATGLTAQEAEYISQKQFSAQRIVTDIFGCPLHRFGLSSAPTYASVELNSLEFVNWTLSPIITNIEQQLQKQLFNDAEDVYVNFNVNGLLRGDIRTRIEYYRFGIQAGILTPNDVNKAESTGIIIPPEKGGDDYVRPLNYGVVGKSSGPIKDETLAISGSNS